MTYELPADTYDGRVELQTLARRIARACVHFIQVRTTPPLPRRYRTALTNRRPLSLICRLT